MKDFDLSAFLADLRTLCAIDSGHFNAPGTAAVADFFESRYRALGLKTERRYYDNNDFAPFLTARNSEDEQIDVLFVAHMDTVFPVGEGAARPFAVDENGMEAAPVSQCHLYSSRENSTSVGSGLVFPPGLIPARLH